MCMHIIHCIIELYKRRVGFTDSKFLVAVIQLRLRLLPPLTITFHSKVRVYFTHNFRVADTIRFECGFSESDSTFNSLYAFIIMYHPYVDTHDMLMYVPIG